MYLKGSVLFDANELVIPFVAERTDGATFGHATSLGIVRGGNLIGGVIYHDGNGDDIRASIALVKGYFYPWRTLFDYPFNTLGVIRLTALVRKQNKASRRLCEALGFKMEGVHPLAIERKHTAISYGMTRDACRWIKGHS